MFPIETRIAALQRHLARENLCLLALLHLGYALAEAEEVLGPGGGVALTRPRFAMTCAGPGCLRSSPRRGRAPARRGWRGW
jgi:hypothetical protein